MHRYSISAPDKPWVVLFSGSDLSAIAEAVAAQPDVDPSSIYASDDGKSRSLTMIEQIELFERVLELRPGDSVTAGRLAAAQLARETRLQDDRSEGAPLGANLAR
jgi:hypothetical protein